jgi:hypothetical protein
MQPRGCKTQRTANSKRPGCRVSVDTLALWITVSKLTQIGYRHASKSSKMGRELVTGSCADSSRPSGWFFGWEPPRPLRTITTAIVTRAYSYSHGRRLQHGYGVGIGIGYSMARQPLGYAEAKTAPTPRLGGAAPRSPLPFSRPPHSR